MKLYKCTRYEEDWGEGWMGALLIFADSIDDAIIEFKEWEHGNKPIQVIELEMKKGIVYNDYRRE